MLECVSDVLEFPEVRELLLDFASHAHFQLKDICLDLADQWVSRRRRWWGLLLTASGPHLSLVPWPVQSPRPSVATVMPELPLWPAEQERQAMFGDPAYGSDARILDLQGTAPTLLHSLGNALGPCPCGCRSAGFTETRLSAGGLRGFGVYSSHLQAVRFLHPSEAALLVTLPADYALPEDMRAGLCLLGLKSAPLQLVWVYSQALNWAHQAFCGSLEFRPLAVIDAFKAHLLQLCKDRWLVPAMYMPRTLSLEDTFGVWPVTLSQPATGRQLIAAEKKLQGPGYSISLHESGRRLPPDAFLHEGVGYVLCVERKRQAKDSQHALPLFHIVLLLPARFHIVSRATPVTLRTLLAGADLPILTGVSVLSGAIVGLDDLLTEDELLDVRPVLPEAFNGLTCSDALVWGVLQQMHRLGHGAGGRLLSPAVAQFLQGCFVGGFESVLSHVRLPAPAEWLCVFLHDGHWTCLQVAVQPSQVIGLCLDGIPGRNTAAARHLTAVIAGLSGFSGYEFAEECYLEQTGALECGLVALQHAALLIASEPGHAPGLLYSALTHAEPGPARVFGSGGLSQAQQDHLTGLLVERGAASDLVEGRVQEAIRKIGAPAIAKALAADNPWAQLKAIASKPPVHFKWIMADELAAHIEKRAADRFGAVANPKGKKVKGTASKTGPGLQVDPQKLQLAPNSFVSADGKTLPQLAFSEVVSQAQGVAFVSVQQAMPFITNYRALSVDPLALAITAELPLESCSGAPLANLRFQ